MDGTIAVSLDLRSIAGPGGPTGSSIDMARRELLREASLLLTSMDPAEDIFQLLRRYQGQCLYHERYISSELYGRTSDSGLCGYIMLSQLEERASAPVGDRDSEYRSPNLWDGLQRETFIQWLRELPGQVRDYQCAPKVQAVIAWVQSNYSGNGDGQPFLSRTSGLWFQTGWLQALEGKIDFSFYSTVDEPGFRPLPQGAGMLCWSGQFGPRRHYSFSQLLTVFQLGNMGVLNGAHYHLLPSPATGTECEGLHTALLDLATRLVELLRRSPTLMQDTLVQGASVIHLDEADGCDVTPLHSALVTRTLPGESAQKKRARPELTATGLTKWLRQGPQSSQLTNAHQLKDVEDTGREVTVTSTSPPMTTASGINRKRCAAQELESSINESSGCGSPLKKQWRFEDQWSTEQVEDPRNTRGYQSVDENKRKRSETLF